MTVLVCSSWLAALLGLPRGVLVATAIANLAYGGYSFSLARVPEAPRGRVRALVFANFAWAVVCIGLAATLASRASWPGIAYVLAEGAFVGGLAAVEAKALRACTGPSAR